MVSVSIPARRAMISSSTRRIRAKLPSQYRLQNQGNQIGKYHQRTHSSLVTSTKSGISISAASKQQCFRRLKNSAGKNTNRSLSSSAPPSSKPPSSAPSGGNSGGGNKQKTGTTELIPNMALASVLGGFVTFVFMYSMNAVGKGDGIAEEGGDPLAQLKAEAQEAREHRDREGGAGGRMTEDEIRALESGLGSAEMMTGGEADGDRIITEVAVAAPADIAALEEEANLKIFRQQQNEGKEPKAKKKAWWRFGIF